MWLRWSRFGLQAVKDVLGHSSIVLTSNTQAMCSNSASGKWRGDGRLPLGGYTGLWSSIGRCPAVRWPGAHGSATVDLRLQVVDLEGSLFGWGRETTWDARLHLVDQFL